MRRDKQEYEIVFDEKDCDSGNYIHIAGIISGNVDALFGQNYPKQYGKAVLTPEYDFYDIDRIIEKSFPGYTRYAVVTMKSEVAIEVANDLKRAARELKNYSSNSMGGVLGLPWFEHDYLSPWGVASLRQYMEIMADYFADHSTLYTGFEICGV